ncbi:MAG: DUF3365 domain-containing protein [Acidobacteria bacterium]|nr:DUF3365 domain-containing protein [Acidobacteriota bacterium]
MIEAALAVRAYTNPQVKPLLETSLNIRFCTVGASLLRESVFGNLRKKFPDYFCTEATLNPTNPVNLATHWEGDIIRYFRQSPQQTGLIGERKTPNGRVLYILRPVPIKDAKCLACHGTPDSAPRTLVERYVSANGFGWKLKSYPDGADCFGATELQIARAKHVSRVLMSSSAGVFLLIFLRVNARLIFSLSALCTACPRPPMK